MKKKSNPSTLTASAGTTMLSMTVANGQCNGSLALRTVINSGSAVQFQAVADTATTAVLRVEMADPRAAAGATKSLMKLDLRGRSRRDSEAVDDPSDAAAEASKPVDASDAKTGLKQATHRVTSAFFGMTLAAGMVDRVSSVFDCREIRVQDLSGGKSRLPAVRVTMWIIATSVTALETCLADLDAYCRQSSAIEALRVDVVSDDWDDTGMSDGVPLAGPLPDFDGGAAAQAPGANAARATATLALPCDRTDAEPGQACDWV